MSKTVEGEITHGELVSNVDYGYWYHLLSESLYGKIAFICNVVQLVAGTSAFFLAMQSNIEAIKWIGLIVAVFACISVLIDPSAQAERNKDAKARFLTLKGKSWDMSFSELNTAIQELRASSPKGILCLSEVAYNRMVKSIGMPEYSITIPTFGRVAEVFV